MKKILILEEAWCEQEIIYRMLRSVGKHMEVYRCETTDAAWEILDQERIDLFILSVNVGIEPHHATEGLEFGKKIRASREYYYTPIIFIGNNEKYEMYAYRNLHCFRYITKPYDREEVKVLLYDVINHQNHYQAETRLVLTKKGMTYLFSEKNIIYIECEYGNINICTRTDVMCLRNMVLREVIERITEAVFIQCHRSYIINRDYVKKFDRANGYLEMIGTSLKIPVGSTYRRAVSEQLRRTEKYAIIQQKRNEQ